MGARRHIGSKHSKASALTVLSVFLYAACGADEAPPDAQSTETIEKSCLNCGIEREEPTLRYNVEPHLSVSPEQLMFYGTVGKDDIEPEIITLRNATQQWVAVHSAYIADDLRRMVGGEGATYFTVEQDVLPMILHPGESLTVKVHFNRSLEQRHALLVFETNLSGYESMVVEMSGKYVVSGGFTNFGGY